MGNSSCPVPAEADDYGERGTSWKPMIYVALVCTVITAITATSLCVLHLQRYRAPKQQRQIIRIVMSVVVYSVVAFFELYSYSVAQYIDPIGDVYEAFGLCALFLLFIQYAAPTGSDDDDTLSAVKEAAERPLEYEWPKIAWIFVFQYPLVEIFCVFIQEITEATGHYCVQSLSPKFSHLWLEIFESVSISFCILAIIRLYTGLKSLMKVRRALSKIVCFKAIVGIRFAQAWIFSTLLEDNVIKTSDQFSYNDIIYGLPSVLSCAEMTLFAAGFWYAFSSTEYGTSASDPHSRPLPLGRAILDAANPSDLFRGIYRIIPLFKETKRSGQWSLWAANEKQRGKAKVNAARDRVSKIGHGRGGRGSGNGGDLPSSSLPNHYTQLSSTQDFGSVQNAKHTSDNYSDGGNMLHDLPPPPSHVHAAHERVQSSDSFAHSDDPLHDPAGRADSSEYHPGYGYGRGNDIRTSYPPDPYEQQQQHYSPPQYSPYNQAATSVSPPRPEYQREREAFLTVGGSPAAPAYRSRSTSDVESLDGLGGGATNLRWNGQRYERSPSPSYTSYPAVEGRENV